MSIFASGMPDNYITDPGPIVLVIGFLAVLAVGWLLDRGRRRDR
jgi:hypothetical protein